MAGRIDSGAHSTAELAAAAAAELDECRGGEY